MHIASNHARINQTQLRIRETSTTCLRRNPERLVYPKHSQQPYKEEVYLHQAFAQTIFTFETSLYICPSSELSSILDLGLNLCLRCRINRVYGYNQRRIQLPYWRTESTFQRNASSNVRGRSRDIVKYFLQIRKLFIYVARVHVCKLDLLLPSLGRSRMDTRQQCKTLASSRKSKAAR